MMAGATAASLLPVASASARSGVYHVRRPTGAVEGDGRLVTTSAPCSQRIVPTDRSTSWAAPLDRIISVQLADTTLRDALDRVASAAHVELSYSSDFLPRDRRVCLALDRVPIGAALESLLAGTSLRAIVISATQVVLAPLRGTAVTSSTAIPTVLTMRRASVLDRVVVTGTPDGASQRGSPFALDVIDGTSLSRTNSGSLGEALELAVPGVWTWTGTAGTLAARFGSVRGASSFGVTTPKIYLDGVEVANPLLVTQLDPARVERVEIIRGPQGAALYGADAISGVVNILTRHDGTPTGALALQLNATAGIAATQYAARDALVQDHALSLRAGSGARTVGLGLSVNTIGAYVPGVSERRILADGDVRFVRARSVVTGTARLSLQQANASNGLLFGGAAPANSAPRPTRGASALEFGANTQPAGGPGSNGGPPPAGDTVRFAGDSAIGQDLTQYTLGATVTSMPSLRWTNTFIAGVDGYRLHGLSSSGLPLPTTYGSDPSMAEGAADRGTMRARAVGRFDLTERTTLALMRGAEQTVTRDVGQPLASVIGPRPIEGGGPNVGGVRPPPRLTQQLAITTWTSNTGILAQGNLAWRDALYLIVGARAERNTGGTPNAQVSYLPMVGATYVHDVRGMVVKVRGAFGTGIRPAHSIARGATWMGRTQYARATTLEPESQSGTEAGVDVLMGRALLLHVTRFDQRASGLIQPVATSTESRMNGRTIRLVGYTLENVGAIDNRGWELQAGTNIDRLRLGASYTIVESRVARVASGYNGDLRAGDRMLDVPARTGSLTATWTTSRWTMSSTLTRAEDWISYDRIAIGNALAVPGEARDLGGARLRDYWARHDDVTRLRANIAYRLSRQFSSEIGGDNLFNIQRGAPDNATVTAGRTLTFGLRTQF